MCVTPSIIQHLFPGQFSFGDSGDNSGACGRSRKVLSTLCDHTSPAASWWSMSLRIRIQWFSLLPLAKKKAPAAVVVWVWYDVKTKGMTLPSYM